MNELTRRRLIGMIPGPRFDTYLQATGMDEDRALDLYRWNIDAGAAVLATMAVVEVALRDTVDRQLRAWNQAHGGSEEWITRPQGALAHIVRQTPKKNWHPNHGKPLGNLHPAWWERRARVNLRDQLGNLTKPSPNHDDLVAALTLGTWVHLIPLPVALGGRAKAPQVTLFRDAINLRTNNVLPGSGFNASANVAHYWCTTLLHARNRAAHLEPLLDSAQLLHWHRVASRTLRALAPGAEVWITGQARIPRIVARKP